ncbi:MAG TPA: SGNH/GDSL hydrolase family protein [Gemmatimonadaceae bacterium]
MHSLRGFALTLGVMGIASSCTAPFADVNGPHAARGDMFDSYVAIGNSITAGYQSGGIIDSTQRRSYAFLLAQSMGTRFVYPSLAGRGCAPLITNFLTQARPAGTNAGTCDLRNASSASDIINNLGVPGAWSYDPNANSSVTSNALTTFFLGGKSQVQRARDARPTFASIWIGNNDVLGPASTACTTASAACAVTFSNITSLAAYSANVDAIIDSLKLTSPNLKGVLIGVVNVSNAPLYFAVTALTGTVKTAFDAIACGAGTASTTCVAGATTINANCTTSPGNKALINTMLAFQIRTNAHPAIISCVQNVPAAPVGDVLVMDSTEQKIVSDAVAGYNGYLSTKANTLGWAYYDPNVDLATLRTAGTVVRPVPNATGGVFSATAPFGTGMSLDGVHPNAAVHLIIANSIITAINAKYGTTLPAVF